MAPIPIAGSFASSGVEVSVDVSHHVKDAVDGVLSWHKGVDLCNPKVLKELLSPDGISRLPREAQDVRNGSISSHLGDVDELCRELDRVVGIMSVKDAAARSSVVEENVDENGGHHVA